MLKNKIFNRVLLTGSFIVSILIIAKLSGVLQYALLPTAGSEPTIKRGGWILISNLLPYEKNKILVYKQNNPDYQPGNYAQRLVGIEGDKIQIKNGDLFVNDFLISGKFEINQAYKIDRGFANHLIEQGVAEEDFFPIDENHYITHLSKKNLKKDYFFERYINTNTEPDIFKTFGKQWNADNFGPLTVPPGKVFFLGDNRNASLDSRFVGFAEREDIVGAVFYPKN
nr:signal peptidase I [uncultured Chryseobacterium sp.]